MAHRRLAERRETGSVDLDLATAATRGDRAAFDSIVAAHQDRIRLHCYRMLGSFHDAEDALQETLLRAWLNIDRFERRSAVGTWLHRIATNTCLNMIRGRPRVVVPDGFQAARRPLAADVAWLEPFPDMWLPAPEEDEPAARIETREATRLAFIAAMQLLPARQRATLLLKDVLGWSAAEIADALETSAPAVNSALQRARTRLSGVTWQDAPEPELGASEQAVVAEFIRSFEARDIAGLVELLTRDAVLAMPPTPGWFDGPEDIGAFLAQGPNRGRLDQMRLLGTGANRQPAVVAYMPDGGGHRAYGVMVLDVLGGRIAAITGFSDPSLADLFGLPERLDPVDR